MLKNAILFVAALVLLSYADASAQKATEVFIPIGESPGLSGKYTIIGNIDSINTQKKTVVVSDSTGSHTMQISEQTKIYLDRSKLNLSNKKGAFTDIHVGMLAEVKYKHEKQKNQGPVDWIKIQVTEANRDSAEPR